MDLTEITKLRSVYDSITKKPEKYLCSQEDVAEELKIITKQLYDFSKSRERSTKIRETLSELVVSNLDEEQIWQQIQLQNNAIHDSILTKLAHLLVKKEKLKFPLKKEKSKEVSHNAIPKCKIDQKSNIPGKSSSGKNVGSKQNENFRSTKIQPSIVDDKFFKLNEMHTYLDEIERGQKTFDSEFNEDNEDIDYFADDSSTNDDNHPKYDDFFDQPYSEEDNFYKNDDLNLGVESENENKTDDDDNDDDDDDNIIDREENNSIDDNDNKHNLQIKKKKVNFDLNGSHYDANDRDNEQENESLESDNSECMSSKFDENNKEEMKNLNPSTFEARQERLKSRINALEEDALMDKPWQLKGEITAADRPQNSLLQEYVEFDIATRPAPILTEKSTMKLEDIIIQRIKDKAWDDVVRKLKPTENSLEYRKQLVLDQEKSKLSLAQIYEQEYLKQVENKITSQCPEKPEIELEEHIKIKTLMNQLFTKLDALSNFHFTPKPVLPDVKVVSNLPAITMEEVAPVATSDAALLAPEEVKAKLKRDLIGKSERTATDKKRERRQKKMRQKLKYQKLAEKANEKLNNVKSKNAQKQKLSTKLLQKITKSSNVTALEQKDMSHKHLKSSSDFFSQLQDETSGKVKKRNTEFGKPKLGQKLKSKKKMR